VRFWDLVIVILEKSVHVKSVHVNRMIVGMFLKSVKKNMKSKIRHVTVAVYKELEMS
jgi:hypothetical protein